MVSLRTFGATSILLFIMFLSYISFLFLRNLILVKKSLNTRSQLRSLLENFDLEIPEELKELNTNTINQIRTN